MSPSEEPRSNAAPPAAGATSSPQAHDVLASRRSVRSKLLGIVLLTTGLALLVSGVAMLLHDLAVHRETSAADLRTQASILALSTAPALAFDDQAIAERNLAALQARPDIVAAAIYTRSGDIYAQFARAAEIAPPARLDSLPPGVHIEGERIELVHRIECGRVALHLREHALLEWIAPAGVRPHLRLAAQGADERDPVLVGDRRHELGGLVGVARVQHGRAVDRA